MIHDESMRFGSQVRTPAGRTAGDVRGRLTEERLGSAVAKARLAGHVSRLSLGSKTQGLESLCSCLIDLNILGVTRRDPMSR